MTSNGNTLKIHFITRLFMSFLLFLASQTSAWSAELISGGYLSSNGKQIELLIHIGQPAPTSLIIQQYYPTELSIVDSSPRPGKINDGKGIVKWFFKNPQTGQLRIRLSFNEDAPNGVLKAVLRYREPATGQFVEKHIRQ